MQTRRSPRRDALKGFYYAAIEALENRRYLSGLQVNGIQQVNEALYAGNAPVTNDLHLIYDVTDDDGTLTNISVVWNTGDDPEDWMPGVDFDPQTGIPHGAFPSTNTDQVYHAVLTFTGEPESWNQEDDQTVVYPLDIVVTNQAPLGSLSGMPTYIAEGEPVEISFSGVHDSAADETLGFRYSFAKDPQELASNWDDASPTNHATFSFDDNGTSPIVYGRVFDSEGAYRDYTIGNESWVYNIAPSATISSTQLEDGFLKVQLGSFYDPSSADTSSGFHFGVRSTNRICNSDCGHVTLPA